MDDYTPSERKLANDIYRYTEMEDEFCYLRDERQEHYLELAVFIHNSEWFKEYVSER